MKPRQWRTELPRTLEQRCDALCKGPITRVVLKAVSGHMSPRYAVAESNTDRLVAYGRGATFDEALTALEGKLK